MTDRAVRNAEQQRKRLKGEVKELRLSLENRERELKEIESFLRQHAKFSAEPPMTQDELGFDVAAINPPKEVIGRDVRSILLVNGKPVKRDELYDRLAAQGVRIYGKNPRMILSTMLWRMPEKFVRLAGHGYWLRDVPYDPAGYDPDLSRATPGARAGDADIVESDKDKSVT